MNQNANFSKRFLSICIGITIVLCSLSLFMFSIKSSVAEIPVVAAPNVNTPVQAGSSDNFVPVTVYDGYAYWVVFNENGGYQFRKSPMKGNHWVIKSD